MGKAHYKSMDCHLEVKKKREETMILLSGPCVGWKDKGVQRDKGKFSKEGFGFHCRQLINSPLVLKKSA